MNGCPATNGARVSGKQQGVATCRQPKKEGDTVILTSPRPTRSAEKRDFMPDTTPEATHASTWTGVQKRTPPSRLRIDGCLRSPKGLFRS